MRYELGITVDGVRCVVWGGMNFPPGALLDMITALGEFVQRACPDHVITWFTECDGKSFSYGN